MHKLKRITHRYPPKYVLMWLAFIAATIGAVAVIMSTASAQDKYDGDCTGRETAGRCVDKPLPGSPPITTMPHLEQVEVDKPVDNVDNWGK